MNIQSPFVKDIPECKLIMRRLRKKISKYSTTHREPKKPRDQCHDILNILRSRNLPAFVMDTIKKRRTFDLLCLKSVVLAGDSTLPDMVGLADAQEKQIQALFVQHKQRLRTSKPRQLPKLEKRSTNCSSTEQDESASQGLDSDSNNQQSVGNYFSDGRTKDQTEEKEEMSVQHSFEYGVEDAPAFQSRDFLSFQGQMYSQEEWLKF